MSIWTFIGDVFFFFFFFRFFFFGDLHYCTILQLHDAPSDVGAPFIMTGEITDWIYFDSCNFFPPLPPFRLFRLSAFPPFPPFRLFSLFRLFFVVESAGDENF